ACRDADAGVAHLDAAAVALGPPREPNGATFRRVLQGVVHQVVENLTQRFLIGARDDRCFAVRQQLLRFAAGPLMMPVKTPTQDRAATRTGQRATSSRCNARVCFVGPPPPTAPLAPCRASG